MKKQGLLFALVLMTSCAAIDKKFGNDKSSAAKTEKEEMKSAVAEIDSAKKKVDGKVTFKETDKGIIVTTDVTGLSPNSVHGIHIHETGKCEGPEYKSAGGHFNPNGHSHAGPGAPKKHVGDLGNLVADAKGNAKKEILLTKEEIQKLDNLTGKSVIIHAKADDLKTDPSGNSGDRIACGIIEQEQI